MNYSLVYLHAITIVMPVESRPYASCQSSNELTDITAMGCCFSGDEDTKRKNVNYENKQGDSVNLIHATEVGAPDDEQVDNLGLEASISAAVALEKGEAYFQKDIKG